MELIEREFCLELLHLKYEVAAQGSGHAVFIMGEAGIGKTSLVDNFIASLNPSPLVYMGSCDALTTPQPLGPLYDIALQPGSNFPDILKKEIDRAQIFAAFLQEFYHSKEPVVLVIEDIHWADEATLDFIKFFTRRIHKAKCLFLLTCRDNQLMPGHPLRIMFGDLPSRQFSKLSLELLSVEAVNKMAMKKGNVSGSEIYRLTGGNPFYVNEILSNYLSGIPTRIKDSILSVFHATDEKTRAFWEMLSILPSRIDLHLVEEMERQFSIELEVCIRSGILIDRKDYLSFKHELYRITIEESLAPYKRKSLHKQMLSFMLKDERPANRARTLHHARFAEEKSVIAGIAPIAALEASVIGAHLEAAAFYQLALDNYEPGHQDLVSLYEHHAYECYLTNQIPRAIVSQTRALEIWQKQKDPLKEGDAKRFLSRLWWYSGDRKKALAFANEAIQILENGFPTRERALAYSNLSQLHMLAGDRSAAVNWGSKAISLATRMHDEEVLSHALNNIGTALIRYADSQKEGEQKLLESLALSLDNNFHEHAARAYTNLSFAYSLTRNYEKAFEIFEKGLAYCEVHDLNSWTYYMLGEKVKALVATGQWQEAENLGIPVYENLNHTPVIRIGVIAALAQIQSRRGNFEKARILVDEAKQLSFPTGEAQRIAPVLAAELELCWLSNTAISIDEINSAVKNLFPVKDQSWHFAELAFWMHKNNLPLETGITFAGPFQFQKTGDWNNAALQWERLGCSYESALTMLEGDDENKKRALLLLDDLEAKAASEMMRIKLKQTGVKNIPRGLRESTRNNIAQLTNRQVEVLNLLREGLQNKEIADRLFISPKTVDHHISAILSHVEVNSRAKAVVEAVRLGIIK